MLFHRPVPRTTRSLIEPLEQRIAPAFSAVINLADLNGTDGFRLSGLDQGESSGRSVGSAGDVNGDGFDDFIIGAPYSSLNASNTGVSYVVFGKDSGFPANFDLFMLNGVNGFRIASSIASDQSGIAVNSAGDVNGDGIDDLIIGTTYGNGSNGASYVVFGRASAFPPTLNLATLNGSNGFKIAGTTGDRIGRSVSSAGDINGDGFDDVVIGAQVSNVYAVQTGASYVVFGKASGFPSIFNVAGLNGANGFKMTGVASQDRFGRSVGGSGDINGDGFDDILIGAPAADPSGVYNAGAVYVVFGKPSGFSASLSASSLDGINGFRIGGIQASEAIGNSVSNAGDVNGDGFDDISIGAYGSGGANYVVYGRSSLFPPSLNLSALNGPNGFAITGITGSGSGTSVGGNVDINADGFSDVIIGARGQESNGQGASYVIFGKGALSAAINVASLNGSNGFKALGAQNGDISGFSVSGIGDFNNDGAGDIVIGAPLADPNGTDTGASYVIYGKLPDPISVSIANSSVVESNSGTTLISFSVTLSQVSTKTISVHYSTTESSATAGVDFTAVADQVLTFNPGETTKTIEVTVAGDGLVEPNETLNVVLANPSNAIIGIGTAIGTILNDDAAGISIGNVTSPEGDSGTTSFSFQVTLTNPSTQTITVDFSTMDGTAVVGSDYTALLNQTLQFAPGETTKSISIDVLGDAFVEVNETFSVILSNPTNAQLVRNTGVGTILDDDTVSASIGNASLAEGDSGETLFLFPVILTKPSADTVTLAFSTVAGSASADQDFIPQLNQPVTFAPGETNKLISISVVADTKYEADESLTVILSNPVNTTIGVGTGVGLILNDDLVGISIGSATVLEGNAGTRDLSFLVTLSDSPNQTVTVGFSTIDGTALAGEDYTASVNQLLQFLPGETSKTITIPVLGDTAVEQNETFGLSLFNPANATIVTGGGTGTIVGDDSAVVVTPIAGGRGLMFSDSDGDEVTVKVNRGSLTGANVFLDPEGNITLIDLAGAASSAKGSASLANASLSILAKPGSGGNGLVNVSAINLGGKSLKNVTVDGALGRLESGLSPGGKPTIQKLTVDSLGFSGVLGAESRISGSVGTLIVKHDIKGAFNVMGVDDDGVNPPGLPMPSVGKIVVGGNIDGSGGDNRPGLLRVSGDIGSIVVKGSVSGGAELSGIVVGGSIGKIKIGGDLTSADANHPVTISALGNIGALKPQSATALKQLQIAGNVHNAQILAGFRRDGAPLNADAGIGRVTIGGNLSATSIAAGVQDVTGDGYGINDLLIDGGRTEILSRIASITIGGTVSGTESTDDHFGITAQQIGDITVGRIRQTLLAGNGDVIPLASDFTVVDFA